MATAIDINDREGLKNVLGEINLDDYKPSKGLKSLFEEDCKKNGTSYREGMVTEDELIEVLRYLRAPSGRGGRSNLEYLSEYKKERDPKYAYGTQYHMPCGVKDALMEEKKKEERDYYGMKFPMSYESNYSNVVQENVEKPKPSLDEIKARYMAEMDALTKRFQDEINNLG